MIEAVPSAVHAATRAPADVEADLGIVARLLSGLPTHVHAGEYAAALAAHLASNSDALRQELHRSEHAPASGTTGARPCAWVPTGFSQGTYGVPTPKRTVRRVRPARARALSSPQQGAVAAHCSVRAAMLTHVRTAAAEPADDADNLAGEAEPGRARAPTVWTCIRPSRVHCARCTSRHCTLRTRAPWFARACRAAVPLPCVTVSLALAGRATAWPRRMAPKRVPSLRPRQAAGGSVDRGCGQRHGASWASHGSPCRQDAHGALGLHCTRGVLGRAAAKNLKAQQAHTPSGTGTVLDELGAPPVRIGLASACGLSLLDPLLTELRVGLSARAMPKAVPKCLAW